MNLSLIELSYGNANSYVPFNDMYGIVSYQKVERYNILFCNPFLNSLDMLLLIMYDLGKVPIARCYYFPTMMKAGEKVLFVQSASALYVQEEYRHLAIGADIISYSTFSEEFGLKLFAGISEMALPIYKKLKYVIFSLKRYMIRRSFCGYLIQKGIKGGLGRYIAKTVGYVNGIRLRVYGNQKKLLSRYVVQRMIVVPTWVDDIVLNDGHKYMEFHDHLWMQWNLSGSFQKGDRNLQFFWGIYEDNNPVGFFMTKERAINESSNIITGSIVEWGAKDESVLSESDIYELALSTFNKDVYIVDFATNDVKTIQRMKRLGFILAGEEHILFKDNTGKYKDANDAGLWRLRYGYADTIFS